MSVRVDAVGIVDEQAAGLYAAFEFVEALLIEYYCGVVAVEDRRGNRLVGKNDGYVGGASPLLRAVGGHPGDFEIVFESCVGEDLTH